MARWLKQSTAFTFRAGPFLDSTDGVTAETALSIAQADIQISKNGGAFAQTSDAAPTTTHDADGWYQCPLTTTDTNTLGPLTVQIVMAGAAPVWHDFMVLPANIYDSLVSGSDLVDVNVAQWLGTAAATPTTAGVPEVDVTHWLGTAAATPTVAGVPEVDVTHWIGTAAATPTTAGVPEVDVTYWNGVAAEENLSIMFSDSVASYSSDTITLNTAMTRNDEFNNRDVVVEDATTGEVFSTYVLDTVVATPAIVLAETPPFTPASADKVVVYATKTNWTNSQTTSILADTGTDGVVVAATGLDAITQSATGVIEIAKAIWDRVITGANHNINGSAGKFLREASEAIALTGTAQAGAASTITLAAGASATDDIYNFERIEIIEGTGAGQSRLITDYNGTTKVATISRAWATNPDNTSVYAIMGAESDVVAINSVVAAAIRLALSGGQIIPGTVDTVTNTHTPTTTEFQADDITEATADHYNGRIVIFTSGALAGQATDITDYAAVGGIGQFTVTALTEAPANNDTFIIV